MQSTDGGKTWHNTSANLPEGMRLISAVSSETEIMVGVDKGKVFKKIIRKCSAMGAIDL
jgi:16S rRNA U1498 N3-methylase RsmE